MCIIDISRVEDMYDHIEWVLLFLRYVHCKAYMYRVPTNRSLILLSLIHPTYFVTSWLGTETVPRLVLSLLSSELEAVTHPAFSTLT